MGERAARDREGRQVTGAGWRRREFLGSVFSALAAAAETAPNPAGDWRNIAKGSPIPKEGYCDQPYVVITDDGNWLCVLTTGAGVEGQAGQHVVATISADHGRTWTPPVGHPDSGFWRRCPAGPARSRPTAARSPSPAPA